MDAWNKQYETAKNAPIKDGKRNYSKSTKDWIYKQKDKELENFSTDQIKKLKALGII